MARTKNRWIPIHEDDMEMDGPYQCPLCGDHIILDATYIDQVDCCVTCPYCQKRICVSGEEDDGQ